MSNHRKRVNYSGEEKVSILRAHFVEGLLVQKNEVIAELLQEHVQLKKTMGTIESTLGPHDTRDQIVDYVNRWTVHVARSCARAMVLFSHSPAHEHWHVDVAYINIAGTFVFMATVIDGFSRLVVAWNICAADGRKGDRDPAAAGT
ncbi:MAG UNVERIFIED_CONTAM: transposase family protein [Planctomycetaceae bacterium]|jgi:transposase InsO family protein